MPKLSTKLDQAQKRKAHRGNKRLPRGPHGGIELLLIQSVDHLGKQGDVVSVKPGYARNYHKRMIEKHRARLQEIQNSRLAGLRTQADELGRQSITIEANANDEGHLYGSVGATEIVNALKRADITITTDQVRLRGPLKELGLYTVLIHLGHEIEAELKVWVVPTVTDEASEKKAEAKAAEALKAEPKKG
jgi:large subunit ribosomal protein L9